MHGSWEGTTLTISVATARNPAYLPDDSEVLISRSTWSLKLSGLVFAGLLVIGRSASYGNVSWTPTFHAAGSPLVVQLAGSQKRAPEVPKIGSIDAVMNKASAANEVVVFHPGNSDDGEDGHGDTKAAGDKSHADSDGDHDGDAAGSGHGSGNGAGTANETSTSAAAGSGHGSAAGTAAGASNTSAAQGSGHGSAAGTAAGASNTSAAQGSGDGSTNGAGTANETSTSVAAGSSGSANGAATVTETSTSAGAGSSGSANGAA